MLNCKLVFILLAVCPGFKVGHMHVITPGEAEDGQFFLQRRLRLSPMLLSSPLYVDPMLWKAPIEVSRKDFESLKEMLQVIIAHRKHGNDFLSN